MIPGGMPVDQEPPSAVNEPGSPVNPLFDKLLRGNSYLLMLNYQWRYKCRR